MTEINVDHHSDSSTLNNVFGLKCDANRSLLTAYMPKNEKPEITECCRKRHFEIM